MEYFVVFIFGAIIGSFLNVCIHRLPLGESIVFPGSRGLFCGEPIKWFDNIPLVSYLVLRGKCRHCSRPIPIRYFLVELVTALGGVCLLFFFPMGPRFFTYFVFLAALIAVTFIDIEHQEIPDVITLPGIPLGILAFTLFRLGGQPTYPAALIDSLLGVVAGGASMFLMGFLGEKIYKREALGGGDVKLMAMIGAFLGWKLVLLTFFLAPVFGAGVGIFMRIKFDKEVIPYGPYLATGAVVSLLFGNSILRYLFMV